MRQPLLARFAAAAAALSAGTAVVVTRAVVAQIDPLALVFCRYAVSVLVLLPFLAMMWPKHRVSHGEFIVIAMYGILFFVLFPWAFNASLQLIPAARGAVGLATIPIQTLVVAAIFGRETLAGHKVAGVLPAFAGVIGALGFGALAVEGSVSLAGDGLMLAGGLCAALYSVFSRPVLMRHGPLFVTTFGMIFAVAALLPYMAVEHRLIGLGALDMRAVLAIMFLGTVAGALQFSLFMWALRWLPPTTTVLYLTLNPLSAMILAALALGETLTAPLIAGLILVLAGIAIGTGRK